MIRHRPLLLTALGFMAGVLIALAAAPPLGVLFALLGIAFVCLIASPRALVFGALLLGAALGALRLTAFYGDAAHDIAREIGPAPVTVIGHVVGEPTLTPGGLDFLLAPISVDGSTGSRAVTGGVAVHAGRSAFDPEAVPGPGDTLRLTGMLEAPLPNTNPGGFDRQTYLAHRAVRCEMRVVRMGGVRILDSASEHAPLRGPADLPSSLAAMIQSDLPDESGGLVSAVLLGRRRAMPPALPAEFGATGTAHLLATAGLHVGILAWWLERLCARLRCSRRASALLIVGSLLAYLALTGGRPAAVRAVLTACLYYGAILFERAPDLPTALAAAVLIILTIQPTALLEADFQLSFMTVLVLALAMPLWEDAWRAILGKIVRRGVRRAARVGIDLIGVSLIAPLAAAPLTAYYFNQWSLVSLPANLLAVPLVALLMPVAVLAVLIALVLPGVGQTIFSFCVGPMANAILGVIGFFAALPGGSVSVASPPVADIILAYALMGGLLFWVRFRQMRRGPAWRHQATK